MTKKRYSIFIEEDTMTLIDEAASRNNISRSAVIRMFLELAYYLPAEKLKLQSPIPALLGINKEAIHAKC